MPEWLLCLVIPRHEEGCPKLIKDVNVKIILIDAARISLLGAATLSTVGYIPKTQLLAKASRGFVREIRSVISTR